MARPFLAVVERSPFPSFHKPSSKRPEIAGKKRETAERELGICLRRSAVAAAVASHAVTDTLYVHVPRKFFSFLMRGRGREGSRFCSGVAFPSSACDRANE